MKVRFLLMILLLPMVLFASDCASDYTLEVRGAYFRPSSKMLRDKFSGGWIDYQLETSKWIDDHVEIWGGVSWICKKKDLEDDSYDYTYGYYSDDDYRRLWILPLSIGSKYSVCLTPCLHLYLGAGITYTFFKLENHSDYFKDTFSKSGFGAVLKSGIRYNWGDYTFVDVFVDYLYQRLHLSHSERRWGIDRNDIDIGGLKVGLGIGVYF